MSILKVAKIQGISKTNYEITVPTSHKLIILGTLQIDSIRNISNTVIFNPDTSGNITITTNITSGGTVSSSALTPSGKIDLPVWTTSTRPTTSLSNGIIGYNSDSGRGLEVYNTTSGWSLLTSSSTLPNGLTSATAVDRVTDIKTNYPSSTTGWYFVKVGGVPFKVWVDMDYDGGGWTLVGSKPINVSIPAVTYQASIGTRTVVTSSSNVYGVTDPKTYAMWMGLQTWDSIVSANNAGRNVVYYTAGSQVALGATGSHNRRSRWKWNGWNTAYAWINPNTLSNEVGGTTPGFWSYHIANGFNFSTYDNDQDAYGGNCSTSYGNAPWWYGACWDGNFWGGNGAGGHGNAAYWTSSGGDYYNYGAIYVK